MCWATTIGQGKSAGSGASRASSAGGPPVEVPTSTSPSPAARAGALLHGPRAAGSPDCRGVGADPVADALLQPGARLDPGAGRGAHLGDQLGPQLVDVQRDGALGLGDEVDRAQPQGLEGRVGAFRGERRHHDHRAGMLDHDAVEAGQPVHLRHVDVEGDDVGREGFERGRAPPAVARELDLEVGLGREDLPQQLSHQGGVVDHQDLDHNAPAPPWLRTRRAGRARRASAIRRDRAAARCGPPPRD